MEMKDRLTLHRSALSPIVNTLDASYGLANQYLCGLTSGSADLSTQPLASNADPTVCGAKGLGLRHFEFPDSIDH
jgi:hypothetical protein